MTWGLKRSVASLLVPVESGMLVLPTAMVSEVQVRRELLPVPGTREWILGYVMWRGIPVSVVSYDALVGAGSNTEEIRKLVVLYPLPGRQPHEFFAFAAHDEPHTTFVDSTAVPGQAPEGLSGRFVAGFLSLPQGLGIIPDFRMLKAAFYDQPSS